ncbi:hypothetical protein FIV42_07210 [Persicimonas caeni]|uniref:Chromosome condensation regulator RCC1 n=1 Tax=Persicimonas caeni TaxID=2292766 RepID=A0A4Y6PR85_PERCE|nr:hypothetical protein [Persicimonas caeni]QDG50527.1 hypothetical protein FIV42_07210 [Persicimonas caeni]QED31748.1 hypothetical protein FRD00_07205 [Persicimonas caeni]
MQFQILMATMGCVVSLLMASSCSLVDEDPAPPPSQEQTSTGTSLSGKADAADTPAASTSTCTVHDDCAPLPNTEHWCSPEGQCRYACVSGYGDANGPQEVDGCECALSNGGREVCDGVDNDCDGVVDNPFEGGRVAAGGRHTCAVDTEGTVHCWGKQTLETDLREGFDRFWEVSAGAWHSCALTRQGTAYCWGDNRYGQVGPDAPRQADEPVRLSEDLQFIDIATGNAHSCGLTQHAEVYCWGRNDYGQLGDGTFDDRAQPVRIDDTVQDFVDVTAGDFHTCAARTNGDVLCWGANILGQAGHDSLDMVPRPTRVDAPEALIFVDAGANHTCGLTGAGRAYCWGNNSYGQLGNDTRTPTHEMQKVSRDLEFLALSAGTTHTCAIAHNGRLFCWGSDVDGRLGADAPGDASSRPRPVRIRHEFTDVTAGEAHTCALSRSGHLYCWGDGSHGQLVPNRQSSSTLPWRVDCR